MSFTVVYTVAPSAGRNDQSSFYSMAILPLAIIRSFHLFARRFNHAGFNVATLVTRKQTLSAVRGEPLTRIFLEFAQAMSQNVAEIRALTGWLLDEGCPSVGLQVFRLGDGLRD